MAPAAPMRCGGRFHSKEHDNVELINAVGSKTKVEGSNSIVVPVKSQAYLGTRCNAKEAGYSTDEYAKHYLLGGHASFTVDLSKSGCSCVAALYFVNMAQNELPSSGGDHYCDAGGVGGVHCPEIDLMEANAYAFHSVVHTELDPDGRDGGYGGGEWSWSGPRDWTFNEYGPKGSCVDTRYPFQVLAEFPIDEKTRMLTHMDVSLTQNNCTLHTRKIGKGGGRHSYPDESFQQLTQAMIKGMTPVLSHYTPKGGPRAAQWLSGVGKDKLGPCSTEKLSRSTCGEVVFSHFVFQRGPDTPTTSPTIQATPSYSPTHAPTHSPSALPSEFPSVVPTHPTKLFADEEGYCCFWTTATWNPCYCTTPAEGGNWCNENAQNCATCAADPVSGHDRIGWCTTTTRQTESSSLLSFSYLDINALSKALSNSQLQFYAVLVFFFVIAVIWKQFGLKRCCNWQSMKNGFIHIICRK